MRKLPAGLREVPGVDVTQRESGASGCRREDSEHYVDFRTGLAYSWLT